MANRQTRRSAIKNILTGAAALSTANTLNAFAKSNQNDVLTAKLKGNINHSVCRWCYADIPLDDLCKAAKEMGLKAIGLIGPPEWPTLQKYGLYSAMCNGAEINLTDGFGDKKFHAQLIKNYSEMIPLMAKNGYKNLICFSGIRRGKTDEQGWSNCIEGLKPLIALAEKYNVILAMELLNSRIDHIDYQCNKTAWALSW